jgi:hypothetical protein
MKSLRLRLVIPGLVIVLLAAIAPDAAAQLKAGAARVDITPAIADLPAPFTSISTNVYVRSLVLDDAGKRVVIVVADLPTIDPQILDDLFKRIASAAAVPASNVIMAVTHTHNGVRLANDGLGVILPGSTKITKMVSERIVESVQQAIANLQPARAGFATGAFHLAASRTQAAAADQGPSPEPATIGVFKVESESGDLISMIVSGGPEPVMGMSMNSKISADVAGVMERYIEQRFADKPVVIYTVASPPMLVVNGRQRIQGATPADPAALMSAVGTILGEEVLAASTRIKTIPELPLSGAVQILTCPGKATSPLNNAGSCSDQPGSKLPRCIFTDKDTGPVDLRIGLIRLGDLSIVTTDANIGPVVWQEVQNRVPSPANTMLLALTYGPVHYVVPDAEYPTNSYQATASMVKRGCAEKGFVADVLSLLKPEAK